MQIVPTGILASQSITEHLQHVSSGAVSNCNGEHKLQRVSCFEFFFFFFVETPTPHSSFLVSSHKINRTIFPPSSFPFFFSFSFSFSLNLSIHQQLHSWSIYILPKSERLQRVSCLIFPPFLFPFSTLTTPSLIF